VRGMTGRFFTASDEDIASGRTTDVYFERTMEVLRAKGKADEACWAEMTLPSFPRGWKWGVLCGLEESLRLLEGRKVDVLGIPEGTVFPARARSGVRLPAMSISGPYSEWGPLETPLLGLLCQATGVATMAARCRLAAGSLPVTAFGARRMHPAIAPMLDRSSYIGGGDGVSSVIGAEMIGAEPTGTMPHALIIMMGSPIEAFKAFDDVVDPSVPRIALVDTYCDEKTEAVAAAQVVKSLAGVRLDTPGSRRGSFVDLVREVRWELDIRGFGHVKIMLSGGLDDQAIPELVKAGAGGFGVGSSISNAPAVDLGVDIVEKDGRPVAKRGKFGGRKYPFKCPEHFEWEVSTSPDEAPTCSCGRAMEPQWAELLRGGSRVAREEPVDVVRARALAQLASLGAE